MARVLSPKHCAEGTCNAHNTRFAAIPDREAAHGTDIMDPWEQAGRHHGLPSVFVGLAPVHGVGALARAALAI